MSLQRKMLRPLCEKHPEEEKSGEKIKFVKRKGKIASPVSESGNPTLTKEQKPKNQTNQNSKKQ